MEPKENKTSIASENILAIIIGVKEYDDPKLPRLEAAENNADEFRRVLRRRKYSVSPSGDIVTQPGGVPDSNIFRRTNGATNAQELLEEIHSFLDESIKRNPEIQLILFYYSGHGALSLDKKKYYLSVRKTSSTNLEITGLSFDTIFSIVNKYGKRLVFIIDSCFSENSFSAISSREDFYLMASSARNETAIFPLDEDYSAFTKRLLEAVIEGVRNGGPSITLNTLFETTKSKLATDGFPEPRCLDKNNAGKIIFDVNNFNGQDEPSKEYKVLIENGMTRIFKALYPNVAIDTRINQKVLRSFPVIISVYLKDLLSSIVNRRELDSSFFLDFYRQLVSFLAFIFIKDLTSTTGKVYEEDYHQFKDWRREHLGNTHDLYAGVIRKALEKYKSKLYIEELHNNDRLLRSVNKIEERLATGVKTDFYPLVDLIFSLITELSFFKHYTLISVRFIDAKKSYYGELSFMHEFSELYGPEPENYRQGLMSKHDSLNNAVIFIRVSALDKGLTDSIVNKSFINLWPLVIDQYCNYKDATKPNLCIFSNIKKNIQGDVADQYFYRSVQLKNERNNVLEYSNLPVYPTTDEWEIYANER